MKRAAFLKRMAFAWAATMLPEIRTPELMQPEPVTSVTLAELLDIMDRGGHEGIVDWYVDDLGR